MSAVRSQTMRLSEILKMRVNESDGDKGKEDGACRTCPMEGKRESYIMQVTSISPTFDRRSA